MTPAVVEDRMDRTTVGVADVTSSFVHNLGAFLNSPVTFFKERRYDHLCVHHWLCFQLLLFG